MKQELIANSVWLVARTNKVLFFPTGHRPSAIGRMLFYPASSHLPSVLIPNEMRFMRNTLSGDSAMNRHE